MKKVKPVVARNGREVAAVPATARVITFLIPYNGYTFGTENKKFKEIDGVLVPFEFTQRLEMPQGAFFAEYKVKDVNSTTPSATTSSPCRINQSYKKRQDCASESTSLFLALVSNRPDTL